MMKAKWQIDFVLRLVTEYKQRVAKNERKEKMPTSKVQYALDNIRLLDRELARMDLILSSGEYQEPWMRNFGLPEVMMLFETLTFLDCSGLGGSTANHLFHAKFNLDAANCCCHLLDYLLGVNLGEIPLH